MHRQPITAACLLLVPLAASAATRTYDVGAFESVSVAAGVDAEISLGNTRSVVAETRASDFDDLRIAVEGNVLRIDRPTRGWFSFRRTDYKVRVVTPVLRSLNASSGADVKVKGTSEGDFSVDASSGSDVEVTQIKGGTVKAHASSGSDLDIAGTCSALDVTASSGSDLDAGDLRCESATVHASSGSDVTVFASRSVNGSASSGSDVRIEGGASQVQVEKSSGADVNRSN
ncbi:MAG: head GIN domain-containing protein [Steroidobacteraceae bacterium]